MRRPIALALLAAIAACAPTPPSTPPIPVAPAMPLPAPAPLPADWRDWPMTPGTWRYERSGDATAAVFTGAAVRLSCGRDRTVMLSLGGRATPDPVTIRTTSVTRSLPSAASGQPPVGIAIVLAPLDPLLDAIAFSRGRFVIDEPGAPPLVLPPHAEIGRVIEDCRG